MPDEFWYASLDEWKQRSDDPGRVQRSRPAQHRCLECGWEGRGLMARFNHYQQSNGHRIVDDPRPTKESP